MQQHVVALTSIPHEGMMMHPGESPWRESLGNSSCTLVMTDRPGLPSWSFPGVLNAAVSACACSGSAVAFCASSVCAEAEPFSVTAAAAGRVSWLCMVGTEAAK